VFFLAHEVDALRRKPVDKVKQILCVSGEAADRLHNDSIASFNFFGSVTKSMILTDDV
jgi:hypothetical protein